jgi:hypothetical protein
LRKSNFLIVAHIASSVYIVKRYYLSKIEEAASSRQLVF